MLLCDRSKVKNITTPQNHKFFFIDNQIVETYFTNFGTFSSIYEIIIPTIVHNLNTKTDGKNNSPKTKKDSELQIQTS